MSELSTLDVALFKQVMRRFVTGLMVVTVQVGEEVHAMTANAIASVSLDPMLMLVCVEKKGRTHELITQARTFGLSILSDAQEELGKKFAYDHDARANPHAHARWTKAVTGAPILTDSLGYLDCRVVSMYDGGDHTIFVGEVLAAQLGRQKNGPLIYYDSKFQKLNEQ